MAAIRKASDVIQDFLSLINTNHPTISTQSGEEVDSVIVTPAANEFERAYILLDYLKRIQSLTGLYYVLNNTDYIQQLADAMGTKENGEAYTIAEATELISVDLDNLVSNWGITRNPGVFAGGYVRFLCVDASPVTIPKGFLVRTAGFPYSEYATTAAVNNETPKFDATDGYYVDIYVNSTTVGTINNVGAGAVRIMGSSIVNVSGITNKLPFDTGADAELDLDLIDRSRDAWLSKNVGTSLFYETLLEGSNNVTDISVIKSGDPLMQRSTYGSADIVLRMTEVYENTTEVYAHTQYASSYRLLKQPVKSIVSVNYSGYGNLLTSDYSLVKDQEILAYGNSIQAGDILVITNPAVLNLPNGTVITIVYQYVKNLQNVQQLIDADENNLLMDDVLAKIGYSIPVDIELSLIYKPGYVVADVRTKVESNINVYFAGGTSSFGEIYERKSFSAELQISNIVDIVTGTEGVDQLMLSTFTAKKNTSRPGGTTQTYPPDETIYFDKYEYPIKGTVTWLI